MKKLILALILLTVVTVCIVSCGGDPQASSTQTTESSSGEDSTVNTTTETTTTAAETTTVAPEADVNPLEGKVYAFLGSSVTYGSNAGGISFVDYIRKDYGAICIKEALSGTTLVDSNADSYVSRMKNQLNAQLKEKGIDHLDHLIVQLSTNDAGQNRAMGKVVPVTNKNAFNKAAFDTQTIIGAMEYIIAYAKETWNCEVSFFTGTYFDVNSKGMSQWATTCEVYPKMVAALQEVAEKWDIGIIDMWNDEEMTNIDPALYDRYMSDAVHPTLVGYAKWWTPKFVEYLMKCEAAKAE